MDLYKYQIIKKGRSDFENAPYASFRNPVSKGDKIKHSLIGSEIVLVSSVYHFEDRSVIYYESSNE